MPALFPPGYMSGKISIRGKFKIDDEINDWR